jgi:methylase of polypeptide subunit release factors
MIISNPPYISKDQIPHCDRGIFHEPSIALFADPSLKFYIEIIQRAIKGWLKDEGYLIFECSPFNVHQIKDLFIQQQDHFEHIEIRFDTNELPRVISGKKKSFL